MQLRDQGGGTTSDLLETTPGASGPEPQEVNESIVWQVDRVCWHASHGYHQQLVKAAQGGLEEEKARFGDG